MNSGYVSPYPYCDQCRTKLATQMSCGDCHRKQQALLSACRLILDQCADTFQLECGGLETEPVKKCRDLVAQIDQLLPPKEEEKL